MRRYHNNRNGLGRYSKSHGMSDCREYRIWAQMIKRCHNPNATTFSRYGKKGIYVCAHWRESFPLFIHDMGFCPSPKHTIDRIDNNSGYERTNCRWVTPREQCRNRNNNRLLTFGEKTRCIAEWSEEFHIHRDTLRDRIKRGWSVELALTKPVKHELNWRAK